MKKGEQIDKKLEEKKNKEKMPKWKMESLQLRVGLKDAAGGGNNGPTKEEQKMLDNIKAANTVKCPFCGRSFNM